MNQDLKDFVSDLITDERWSPTTLKTLFSVPSCTWISVHSLCEGLENAALRYRAFLEAGDTEVTVTWLAHPIEPDHAFLVLFYQDQEMASYVAIVTKTYLRKFTPVTEENLWSKANDRVNKG